MQLFKCFKSFKMQPWLKISILLALFGFFKEFRPSEPYIFEYLNGPQWANLSDEQVYQEVYPVGTYSYLGLLVVVFLATDVCRYKPFIVASGFCGVIIWSLLFWTFELWTIQTLEVFYGFFMAAEVAYYTYMYAKVSHEYYSKVTSHARAAALIGRFTASVIAQMLISWSITTIRELNAISLIAMVVATATAFLLPSVPQSIYFNQQTNASWNDKCRTAFSLLWNHFKTAYSSAHVVKWSLWWALATCCFIQVVNYEQILWSVIRNENPGTNNVQTFNGGVEACLTLLGAAAALLAGVLRVDWNTWGETALAVHALVGGVILLISAVTNNIWVCYVFYIMFGVLYHFMITVTSSEVAKKLPEDSYGLIFGINTLMALVFQTILTVVVVSSSGFALEPRGQYVVYGVCHLVLGVIFVTISAVKIVIMCRRKRKNKPISLKT